MEKGILTFEADVNKTLIKQQINKLEVSESHSMAISGHEDNSIKFYDLNSGKCIKTIIAHTDAVSSLLSKGQSLISGGHDGSIRAWDLRTFTCVFDTPAHRRKYDEGVQCLAYNDLYQMVATGKHISCFDSFRRIGLFDQGVPGVTYFLTPGCWLNREAARI
jgi:WD40 repeat protein